jgi:sulfur-oxidizing protein SoxX
MASDVDYGPQTVALMKASFHDKGQAKVSRLEQDEPQKACSEYAQMPMPKSVAQKIEQDQLANVKYPADGKLLGNWKNGESIAQVGTGMQFSDAPGTPAGGNCYACHQIGPQELSFGTMGPSLYNYGKLRGNTADTQRYTYGKIYNSKAYSACSSMPRFGQQNILTEQQIKDLTALLLDPESPVNK